MNYPAMTSEVRDSDHINVSLRVNGSTRDLRLPPLTSLAEVLRVYLGLTGTKVGCNAGDCGACTVLMDRKPVMSCQVLGVRVKGEVTTIEGLTGPTADALRTAFIEEAGFQCGFCTSGQLVACYSLVSASASLSDAELAASLAGNLCRCTGYAGIIRAVRSAAQGLVRSRGEPPR
jgi:aerobic-type carbon monoxide dehydrogenase small subunit (CoxS/CutS family)